jgi:cytochrome c peroxidase
MRPRKLAATRYLAGVALALLAACIPSRLASQTGQTNVLSGSGAIDVRAVSPEVREGFSGIRVTVVWPERNTLAIPADADSIDVAAFSPGAVFPLKSTSLIRRVGVLSTQAEFSPLPSGPINLRVVAKDTSGTVLARADVTIDLRPNEIMTAHVPLVPVNGPTITSVTPQSGVPGTTVSVFGGAFGATSAYPLEVFLGTGSFKVPSPVRLSDGLIVFALPEGAPSGQVVVKVAGQESKSAQNLITIASISITPTSTETFAPSGLVDLRVVSHDAAGNVVPAAYVPFDIKEKSSCPGSGCSGGDTLRVDGDVGSLNIGSEPGVLTIEAGSGSVRASAVVSVHALTKADLPAGMGALGAVPVPANNAQSSARITLGRMLFFEPKLSRSGAMSCATCHDPAKGFSDGRRFGLGNDGLDLPRHTPTIWNAAFNASQFWDGRAASLEEQVLGVVNGPREFNSDVPAMLAYLAGDATYSAAFTAAYDATPSLSLVQKAIAVYERTIVSPANSAAFDRWAGGDNAALSAAQLRGLGLFLGKGRCVACHDGPALTDNKFHNVAVEGSGTLDTGRFNVTGAAADRGAFKTPTLRNVEVTAPYFHDGSRATLEDATRHYETFRRDFPNKSPKLFTIFFQGTDRQDLVEFQKALTATSSF